MDAKNLLGCVLVAVIVVNWNIQAKAQVDFAQNATITFVNENLSTNLTDNKTQVRETRFARPYYGFIGIWNTLGNIRYIFTGVS